MDQIKLENGKTNALYVSSKYCISHRGLFPSFYYELLLCLSDAKNVSQVIFLQVFLKKVHSNKTSLSTQSEQQTHITAIFSVERFK